MKKFEELRELTRPLNLKTLIKVLSEAQKKTPGRILKYGFNKPHSWRGIYAELAFEPKEDVPIDNMLSDAKSALGQTFTGYKGGDNTMGEFTEAHLCYYGESDGIPISLFILKEMEVL